MQVDLPAEKFYLETGLLSWFVKKSGYMRPFSGWFAWSLRLIFPALGGIFFVWPMTARADPDPARIWADSVLAQMTDTALLGQLIMIRAHSDWESDRLDQVAQAIEQYQLGGLCFFQGGPGRQVQLTNRFQQLAEVSLFIAMDAEWGLGWRLDSAFKFPYQMTLGAIRDNDLIFDMGLEIARDLRRVGVHINFAPVLDVNNNPGNPVINFRSFGENRYQVTAKGYAYIQGLKAGGVLACAKHFPGHGDTEADSHVGLPMIRHERGRLDQLELFPFRALAGVVPTVMVAHLAVPALEPEENRPTTLSRRVITGLLREQMNYQGLIFTDAMDMGGVTGHWPPGRAEAEALKAGNDMLLLPADLERTLDTLLTWLRNGKLDRQQVQKKARRVLMAKYRMGLTEFKAISTANLMADLHREEARGLKKKLFAQSLTLLRDSAALVPVLPAAVRKPLLVRMGGQGKSAFFETLAGAMPGWQQISLPGGGTVQSAVDRVKARKPDLIVVTLEGLQRYPRNQYGLKGMFPKVLRQLEREYPVLVVLMGNPYVAAYLEGSYSLMCTYQDDPPAQQVAAEALLGQRPVSGRLPVTAGSGLPAGRGLQLPRHVIDKKP